MKNRHTLFRDQFWQNYFEDFVNDPNYWYQPKGFAIRRETLPKIYERLKVLKNYQGRPWKIFQKEYTKLLLKKNLVELRKPKRHYTASDYSAISRMNKVVFSTLGPAWVDPKSTVSITEAGEYFLKTKCNPQIIEEQILKYQLGNPCLPQIKNIKLFPLLFLLELLLNFPRTVQGLGISKDEYILFVSRAQSAEQMGLTLERIEKYRGLSDKQKQVLMDSLDRAPIITEGKIRAHSRRSSLLNTIQLDSSYALDFLCFPHYICCEPRGPRARIYIPEPYWRKASALVRKYRQEFCYIEFASEKDWFSYYGDRSKKGTFQEALEYYETTSKLPQALEVYSAVLRKGMLKERTPLNLEAYATLRFREKMLEDFLELNLEQLEKGLKLIKRQFPTLVGPIDILALDAQKHYLVIELKKGKTSDKVLGQLYRYMGYIEEEMSQGKYVRGTVVSQEIDRKLIYAFKASQNPHLQLFRFQFVGQAEELK